MQLIYARDGSSARALTDDDLVELYRHPAPDGRAWLRTNFVMTLDGSVQGPDGRSGSINTPSDNRLFALHRTLCDAVLVGASTVRNEGYRAVDLDADQQARRVAEGLAPFPTLVIVSGSATLDPAVATPDEGEGGPVMVVTTPGKPAEQLALLRDAGIEVVESDGRQIDLAATLDQLAGAGLQRLLCEGGPRLHRDLLAAGLVDELSLTLSSLVVGGEGLRSTTGPVIDPPGPFTLDRALFAPEDGTLFTSYVRADTPA